MQEEKYLKLKTKVNQYYLKNTVKFESENWMNLYLYIYI